MYSWRLGISLGIDPISCGEKVCNFDCLYCQLGRTTKPQQVRKVFVSTEKIIHEIQHLPNIQIDYLTFSSRGEPTLAENLGEIIREIRSIRSEKIAVITNASLMHLEEVKGDLLGIDHCMAKLDACTQDLLFSVNRPVHALQLNRIIEGLKEFRKKFQGKLSLQVMLIQENKDYAKEIAQMIGVIGADEIQLNTPLRPSNSRPLFEGELRQIQKYFSHLPVVNVYDKERKEIAPLDSRATARRHGSFSAGDQEKS